MLHVAMFSYSFKKIQFLRNPKKHTSFAYLNNNCIYIIFNHWKDKEIFIKKYWQTCFSKLILCRIQTRHDATRLLRCLGVMCNDVLSYTVSWPNLHVKRHNMVNRWTFRNMLCPIYIVFILTYCQITPYNMI